MKKIILALIAVAAIWSIATPAEAYRYYYGPRYGYYRGWGPPLVAAGVGYGVGYGMGTYVAGYPGYGYPAYGPAYPAYGYYGPAYGPRYVPGPYIAPAPMVGVGIY